MRLVQECPDGRGPLSWVCDRMAEAVGRLKILPHRGDNGAPGSQVLAGLFAEAAEVTGPLRWGADEQPGRPGVGCAAG